MLGIEVDSYRILTDENDELWPNDPVLFPKECFEIVDATRPAFWVSDVIDVDEIYAAWIL